MRVVIIDGYNVLLGSDRYRDLANRDLDSARSRLVSDVAAWTRADAETYVVFDAAENPSSDGVSHSVIGISVMFSSFGRDADSVIEDLVATYRDANADVLVVTSDAQTQRVTMGSGVTRMSAAEFGRVLDGSEEQWREDSRTQGASRIEERIDPDVRRALDRLAGRTTRE